MKAPFPWFGGKSRAASLIWERFGDVANYVEPFAGSLAVLLARPHEPRIETVNDLDCYLANFWRAVAADPEQVARFADGPVNEADLHARHRRLVDRADFRAAMRTDPEYFDAKLAGWWVWGLCAWIGSGWCAAGVDWSQPPDLGGKGTGQEGPAYGKGVHALSMRLPMLGGSGNDARGGNMHPGRGVHSAAMREPSQKLLGGTSGAGAHARGLKQQLPHLSGSTDGTGFNSPDYGKGTHAAGARSRLPEVFAALAARLRYVRVACGDWSRVLTDSVTWRHGTTGVLLDPPYSEGAEVYGKQDRSIPADVRAWALEHGDDTRLRIALCGYEGEHDMPATWERVAWKAKGGYGGQRKGGGNENAARERVWFSPGCLRPETRPAQADLFGGAR